MFKYFSITCLFLATSPAIAQVNSIAFTSTTISPPIALTPNTALPLTSIGTVNIKSANANGFVVNLGSSNGGTLKRSTGETVAYTLNYNGIEQNQITIPKIVEDVNNIITACASTNGCDRNIQIAISQAAISAKPAGSYSDQLTFTLIAK